MMWVLIKKQSLPAPTHHCAVIPKHYGKWKMGNKSYYTRTDHVVSFAVISTLWGSKYYIIVIGSYPYASNRLGLNYRQDLFGCVPDTPDIILPSDLWPFLRPHTHARTRAHCTNEIVQEKEKEEEGRKFKSTQSLKSNLKAQHLKQGQCKWFDSQWLPVLVCITVWTYTWIHLRVLKLTPCVWSQRYLFV